VASSKSLAKKRHSDEWWENHAPPGILRCTCPQKNGKQCNMEAVPGLNVCGQHGGKTPAAIAAAFTRLGGAVEDAADVVKEIMNDPNQSGRDRLAAASHVMKLLGMEKERHEHTVTVDPIEALFAKILNDSEGLASGTPVARVPDPVFSAFNAAVLEEDEPLPAALPEADIVEAEIVDDEEPHTVRSAESMSSAPPPHIQRDLEALGLLPPSRGRRR